ncbi:lipopolysaccharide assembly protein LapB [Granulicella sp. L46]|uniref:tetratricopeptide repeat protein n=1 Tax=Granulicella sp. L46 TaxID=1641865 RepID=UPI0020B158CA|nr:tetratricopeptide repeat protein [Granulicella sp. L46]
MTRSIIEPPVRETIRPALGLNLLLITLLLGGGATDLHAGSRVMTDRSASERAAAERALMQGQIDEAVARAQRLAAADPKDGQAYLLLCRSFYAEAHAEEAIDACTRATEILPRSSDAQDWLGRAYGMKAERAGPIAGLSLALKVRAAFESAVALDPGNGDAINDLGEFYIDAPMIIGGGLDKSAALANQAMALRPQPAHRILAMTAEKKKDYGTAEREFRAAVAVANRADAWNDLGAFYRRRGEYDKAVEALKQGLAVDRAKDASLVDTASLLDRMHREPELAEKALRDYLGSGVKSDDAPAIKVHVMLGKLLQNEGDKAGAKIEFETALQMASRYAPAKQALQQL